MNEQQLADLLSEQIDHLLAGEPTPTSPDGAELAELLRLGQQLSQVDFQTPPGVQAAFQNQLANWFGVTNGNLPATLWRGSRVWFISLSLILVVVGTALGLTLLTDGAAPGDSTSPAFDQEAPMLEPGGDSPEPSEPPASTTSGPEEPVPPAIEPPGPATPVVTPSPAGASLGDTLPPETTSSLGESIPTTIPEPTSAAEGGPNDDDSGDGDADQSDDEGDQTDGDDSGNGDDDKGHGNDPDGVDEDNPGNSTGVPDGNNGNGIGQGQGQDNPPGGIQPGDLGGGNGQGGGQGGGGQSGGSGQGNGGGQGGGRGRGNGRQN